MSSLISVKASFQNEIRKITLESKTLCSITALQTILKKLFTNLPLSYTLQYQDQENDRITFDRDWELKEALNSAQQVKPSPVLKIFITPKLNVSSTSKILEHLKTYSEEIHSASLFNTSYQAGVVQHVTLPSRTLVKPGVPLKKIWIVSNTGKKDWPKTTALVYSNGAVMKASKRVHVGSLKVGSMKAIEIAFESPYKPGNHVSYWFLSLGAERKRACGQFSINIIVKSPCMIAKPASYRVQPSAPRGCVTKILSTNQRLSTKKNPNEKFYTIYKIQNCGKIDWPKATAVYHITGNKFQVKTPIEVGAVKPGKSVEVVLPCVAPQKSGKYCTYWTLAIAKDIQDRFGERLYLEVVVKEPESSKILIEEKN